MDGKRCVVAIENDLQQVRISKLNFKKAWVSILAEKKEGVIEGTLIDVSRGGGVVKFAEGMVLCLPLEYIRLCE